jgi:hypothetical protein
MRPAMTTLVILFAATVLRAAAPDAGDLMQGDKTLVAWVAPANLTQRNVGVLTLDNMAGNFDGIIFGELFPEKWMAGSDWFRRTERNQQDWPVGVEAEEQRSAHMRECFTYGSVRGAAGNDGPYPDPREAPAPGR